MVLTVIYLSLITALTSFAVSGRNEIDAEKFASEVSAMISAEKDKSNLPGNDTTVQEKYKEFETARLIVKSSSKIDTLDALSVISGFNNLWILQFESAQNAYEAFKYYSSRSGIAYIEPDKPVSALSYSYELSTNSDNDKTYLSWGASHIGIDVFNKSAYGPCVDFPAELFLNSDLVTFGNRNISHVIAETHDFEAS